jgi:hypothetical protein
MTKSKHRSVRLVDSNVLRAATGGMDNTVILKNTVTTGSTTSTGTTSVFTSPSTSTTTQPQISNVG